MAKKKTTKKQARMKSKPTSASAGQAVIPHSATIDLKGIWPFRKWKVPSIVVKSSKDATNQITWKTYDQSDFAVWFDPHKTDPLKAGPVESTNGSLTREVGDSASAGTYEYRLLCFEDGELAEGSSPPTMIIQ